MLYTLCVRMTQPSPSTSLVSVERLCEFGRATCLCDHHSGRSAARRFSRFVHGIGYPSILLLFCRYRLLFPPIEVKMLISVPQLQGTVPPLLS